MVIASFLRLVTHPKIFVQPTPMPEALHFIDALLEAAGMEPAMLGGEWPILRQLCVDKALSNNDVPDAWLAAAANYQRDQDETGRETCRESACHSVVTSSAAVT